jgi:hypothetical protein
MAKYMPDSSLDAMLDKVGAADRLFICSGQPSTYAEASASKNIATQTLSSAFSKGDSSASGRKLVLAAQSAISVSTPGTADHWAVGVSGTSTLLLVGTIISRTVASGDLISFPSTALAELWDYGAPSGTFILVTQEGVQTQLGDQATITTQTPGSYDWLLISNATRLSTVNWPYAGVPGGIEQYLAGGANARTLGPNVVNYGADPTGVNDSTTAFANAIAAATSGQYVYVPNGTYKVGGLTLKSNVSIRGQSSAGTIINLNGDSTWATTYSGSPPTQDGGTAVTAGATRGSSTLTLSSVSGFSVGQMVQLTDLTPSWIHPNLVNGWTAASWSGITAARLLNGMWMVDAVDTNAKTVTLNHPLPIAFPSSPKLNPWTMTLTKFAGIENLTFELANNSALQAVQFVNAYACWCYGVYFHHMFDRSLWVEESCNCAVQHCVQDLGQHTGSNSEGLDFIQNACWCKVEDSIFHSGGYAMIIFCDWQGGCVGNIISYNYQDGENQLGPDQYEAGLLTFDDGHGPQAMFNLYEGNWGEQWCADGYWGSTSYGTCLRNRWIGVPTDTFGQSHYSDVAAVLLCRWSYWYNFVGNVLGTLSGSSWSSQYSHIYEASGTSTQANQIWRIGWPDMGNRNYDTPAQDNPGSNTNIFDSYVAKVLLRHGNWDAVNNAVLWDSGITSHAIPTSLYLTAKPSWWGSYAWPAIGPDVSGYFQPFPAYARFQAYKASGNPADLF